MKGQLLFLGTGSSTGIPVISCTCPVCQSNSPLNKRLRPSALLKIGKQQFLIDAGPDLRQQALRYQITKIDGVLLTHAHHDHTAGIDELRVYHFRSKKSVPVLLSKETADDIKRRYDYIFHEHFIDDKLVTKLDLKILTHPTGKITFEGIPIQYMSYEQGKMPVNGYRIGDFAYLSDIRHYPPDIFDHLIGVKTLVISALAREPTHLHFSVDEAIAFINKVGAKKGYLTHISHDLEHDQINAILPPHVRLSYDGLEIDF
ncbi:MAG: MBL fold metallo-hydrolase [Parachlamydiaceae bacterium]|nr:MBL fold metallo-hydrolase [Parachlamydiaceae bacterium]